MPDVSGTAQSTSKMAEALAALFGKGKAPAANPADPTDEARAPMPAASDTAEASAPAAPSSPGAPSPTDNKDGLMAALHGLLKFMAAKPGSASNDAKYQAALTDAGIPADQTGIGR